MNWFEYKEWNGQWERNSKVKEGGLLSPHDNGNGGGEDLGECNGVESFSLVFCYVEPGSSYINILVLWTECAPSNFIRWSPNVRAFGGGNFEQSN